MSGAAEAIQNKTILIVGTARDVEGAIAHTVSKLAHSFSAFQNIAWLIIESDSSDNTIAVLQKLSTDVPYFRFISMGALQTTMPRRTERLAACRNVYLKEIRENPAYADLDYVAVADLDGVNNLLTPESVLTCWTRNDWDVCTANQAGPYYDIWALRHQDWSPNDCWEQFRFLERMGTPRDKGLFAAVYSKMLRIPRTLDWIPVQSAFGGLGIYRREALLKGTYTGLNEQGVEICDHPTLHETLIADGRKIFINPQLINTDYTDHTNHMRLAFV